MSGTMGDYRLRIGAFVLAGDRRRAVYRVKVYCPFAVGILNGAYAKN
ncbi:MAG: hypothetical protein V2A58_12685 [Planctomycetota bacterium]